MLHFCESRDYTKKERVKISVQFSYVGSFLIMLMNFNTWCIIQKGDDLFASNWVCRSMLNNTKQALDINKRTHLMVFIYRLYVID